jgi:glyoxylate reductase
VARVLLTRSLPFDAITALKARHDIVVHDGALPPDTRTLTRLIADADGILCLLTDRVDAALLNAAPHLRVVSNFAVGCDNIDLAACRARGIPVGVTPDVLTEATADLAFALMLAAARRLAEGERAVRAGDWRTWEPAGWLGTDVHGAILALVGAGRIGEAVARRAAGFGMEIVRVGRRDDLHAALAQADFVSLHTPLTDATRHLIDARALAACKPGAILVNTARGGIVDHVALAAALHAGHLGAAALDVTDPEPLPATSALLDAPNLLVVPHIGSATRGARERMAALAVANLVAGLEGAPLPHPAPPH